MLAAASPSLAPVLLALTVIVLAARAGGEAATRLRQPSVVGEIAGGILLGNLGWLGVDTSFLRSESLEILSELGILILLFEIGVEATVPELFRVGKTALLVGAVGVVAPVVLGTIVSLAFAPGAPFTQHLFVGAILSATSVGLTARVMKDLGATQRPETRALLGAAVIDDVLGLLLLAVVSGLVGASGTGEPLHATGIAWIVGKALLFFVITLSLGRLAVARLFRTLSRAHSPGLLLTASLLLCLALAWLSTLFGLAPIIGAFTAGLLIESPQIRPLEAREGTTLHDQLAPLATLLVPIFFVLIGMKVDLGSVSDAATLAFATALLVAAVVGKLVCAAVVRPPLDRWLIGIGMVPRGEVGFVFAGTGAALLLDGEPIISGRVFGAVVLAVIGTTVIAPAALARRLRQVAAPSESAASEPMRGEREG